MRDIVTIDEEASYYFRDPSYERNRFPFVSGAAVVDRFSLPKKNIVVTLPSNFSNDTPSRPLPPPPPREVRSPESSDDSDSGIIAGIFYESSTWDISFDYGSCGTLDYSLCSDDQDDLDLDEQLLDEEYVSFDERLKELDVHQKTKAKGSDCLNVIPMDWLVNLLQCFQHD